MSRTFFAWFDTLALKGFRKPLEADDLWDMNPEDSSREIVPKFEKHWYNTIRKAQGYIFLTVDTSYLITLFFRVVPNENQAQAKFKSRSGHVDFVHRPKRKLASVLPAIFKTFGPMFLFGSMLKLVQDLLTFVSPQILG